MDKIDPGPGYRLVNEGEIIEETDESYSGGGWGTVGHPVVGSPCKGLTGMLRRKLPTEPPKPTVAPAPGSPEDQASLAELDALIPPPAPGSFVASNEALRRLSESMASMGPPKESYTIQEVRESQEVRIKAPYPVVARAEDWHRAAAEELADKPVGTQIFRKGPSETDLPAYNNAMTHCTIPATHEWIPKPFTPNKYTRELLALDGRRVPVDVYSVLAAFPVGNAAVDHALKKLLAPGQRGQKDRLQDLKEARASLDRAIQMEGG